MDGYVDCTKDDNESTNGSTKTTVTTTMQNLKPRKRGKELEYIELITKLY